MTFSSSPQIEINLIQNVNFNRREIRIGFASMTQFDNDFHYLYRNDLDSRQNETMYYSNSITRVYILHCFASSSRIMPPIWPRIIRTMPPRRSQTDWLTDWGQNRIESTDPLIRFRCDMMNLVVVGPRMIRFYSFIIPSLVLCLLSVVFWFFTSWPIYLLLWRPEGKINQADMGYERLFNISCALNIRMLSFFFSVLFYGGDDTDIAFQISFKPI